MTALLIALGASLVAFWLGVAVGKRAAAQRIVDAVLARETRLESLAEDSGVLEPTDSLDERPIPRGAAMGLTVAEIIDAERRERGW